MASSSAVRAMTTMMVVVVVVAVATLSSGTLKGCEGQLLVSQYLPNDAAMARNLSQNTLGDLLSYSGFFTVNTTYDSNIFFWFFPSQDGNSSAPILIWLQGGPGASSMFGLFEENGPFKVVNSSSTDYELVPNPYTWNQHYSMLYFDNPVGAGFSFTNDPNGFAQNQDDVATNLYSALTQFYELFPNYLPNDLYITGESYGGKYVPSFAYRVHQMISTNQANINLRGISVGDGAMNPSIQFVGFYNLLYYMGLADESESATIEIEFESKFTQFLKQNNTVSAFEVFDQMLNGDFWPYPTYYENITGLTNYFNFQDPQYPPFLYPEFLNLSSTRESIHVGNVAYWDYNATVETYLIPDWMRSVQPEVTVLLNNYKVLIYNGQNDVILGAPLCENFLRTIEWDYQEEYLNASKIVWWTTTSPAQVAGYVREVENFRQVVVRDAGHLLPLDQPAFALDMITRYIDDIPFY